MFPIVVLAASLLAGAVAAVSGFGIGSLLTPLLATQFGTKLAAAIVSVPHLVATVARFVGLRQHPDRKVSPQPCLAMTHQLSWLAYSLIRGLRCSRVQRFFEQESEI